MTAAIPAAAGRFALPADAYASKQKQDWERNNLDSLFEMKLKARPTDPSVSPKNSATREGGGHSRPELSQVEKHLADALTKAYPEMLPRSGDVAKSEATVVSRETVKGIGQVAGLAELTQRAFAPLANSSMPNTSSIQAIPRQPTAAENPATERVTVRLEGDQAQVWIRSEIFNGDALPQLRHIIASRLSWLGLALAELKLNGIGASSSESSGPRENQFKEGFRHINTVVSGDDHGS